MSRFPMISFELLPGWFEVPLRDDVDRWAHATATRALETVEDDDSRSDVEQLRTSLAAMAGHAVAHQPTQAFLYCPDPAFGPRLLVEVVTLPAPATFDAETFAGWLAADQDQRFRPDEVEPFESRSGGGLHATERWVDEHSHVYETWFYSWLPDGYDVLVVASTTFADLTLAGLAEPEVDAFMATFTVADPAQPGNQA